MIELGLRLDGRFSRASVVSSQAYTSSARNPQLVQSSAPERNPPSGPRDMREIYESEVRMELPAQFIYLPRKNKASRLFWLLSLLSPALVSFAPGLGTSLEGHVAARTCRDAEGSIEARKDLGWYALIFQLPGCLFACTPPAPPRPTGFHTCGLHMFWICVVVWIS